MPLKWFTLFWQNLASEADIWRSVCWRLRGCSSNAFLSASRELPRAVRGVTKHAGVGVRAGMFAGEDDVCSDRT